MFSLKQKAKKIINKKSKKKYSVAKNYQTDVNF